ncbi:NADH:flavin oxidoreductase/NADH oxidase [Shimazuella kribbensis]|uniref:NADH:flavin oxidoreductase/NADH oxidase n=1 Tax=Shimazuella kribbensis TaxID=139808 RepID=UPI0004037C20|nr:NADH:flavin oxidoreductase/NADH oxidase [Shimazuella kribbensis]
MNHLASTYQIKNLHLKNRIVMPPMCQYSVTAKDGIPNDWHFVHYVSRAIGGTGLIIMEMTDIEPDGRISDYDLGLWSNDQIPAFRRIIDEVHKYGTKIGIQIAHAGRKAEDAEIPVSSTYIAANKHYKQPRALTTEEVKQKVIQFKEAAIRAVEAGVDTIEIHGAHGYLIHQFHSPAINQRNDKYGLDLALFGTEVIQAIKSVIPPDMPLLMRISAVEYMDGGYDLEHSIALCRRYSEAGVDMFHISSGGEGPSPKVKPRNYPGYQVPYARSIKEALHVPVIAVGMLDDPTLAEATLANGNADLVAIGRAMLRDPYWALHALQGEERKSLIPKPYERGFMY